MRIFDQPTMLILPQPKIVEQYVSSRNVKLSFHSDGFTQFSGPGVISGIDKATGKIKDLGIKARPFSNPVWSGATFRIIIWGLEDFDTCEPAKDDIKFYSKELSRLGSLSNIGSPVRILGYILSRVPDFCYTGSHPDVKCEAHMFDISSNTRFRQQMRVIFLSYSEVFLAIDAVRLDTPLRASSWYAVSSPRDAENYGIYAVYPKPVDKKTDKTLDYLP